MERYGDAPGSSFHLVRKAQSELVSHQYRKALSTIDAAIKRTPGLLNAYFIRTDVRLSLRDTQGADQDVAQIHELLNKSGGLSEGDEARLDELEVKILVEKRLLRQAKEKVEGSNWLPYHISIRLLDHISRAVAFEPSAVDSDLRNWAANHNKGKKR